MQDAPASHLQIIRIASRVVAASLLLWVVDDLTLVPREILTVAHEVGLGTLSSAFATTYYARVAVLELSANFLRIALWLIGAGWFYRCGPRMQRFFSPEAADSHLAPASNLEP
ncbi:MAG TPA: hypothetical protein VII58_02225 [Acidobacteriaceae bacterium]